METRSALALALFAATYVGISARTFPPLPIGRAGVAMLGAGAMVATGVLDPEAAYRAVDGATLVLLFGMMFLAGHLQRAGGFAWLADRVASVEDPRVLLVLTGWVAGLASALLVNDAVCVMLTPVVLAACSRRGLPPLPFLLAVATGSNLGGVMTLTGTPQCMLIGTLSGIAYLDYLVVLGPVGVVGLCVQSVFLVAAFGRTLGPAPPADGVPPRTAAVDPARLRAALVALAAATAGFALHLDLAFTALVTAAGLAAWLREDARPALERVDWPLLVFFAALFVVVEGLASAGWAEAAFSAVAPSVEGAGAGAAAAFAAATVVGSNLVSNVPLVMVVGRWIPAFDDPLFAWTVLAAASTFAGNLTLVGSVANLIVAEIAGPRPGFGFRSYLRFGAPLTLATTAAGTGMVLGMRALGWGPFPG